MKGNLIPDVPPSIFPGVPSSCVRQTSDKCYRDVESKRVSQEARENAQEEKLRQERLEADQICDWVSFIEYCHNLEELIVIPKQGSHRSVSILRMSDDSPTSIIYSMEITEHFEVICYLSAKKIHVFKNSFDKNALYSQFDSIISSLEEQRPCLEDEAEKCSRDVRRLSQLESSDDQSYRLEYLSSQLDLIASKPEGRRYTSVEYRQTIDLCLRGRHAYNALRNICILPSMKSIHKLFGNMSNR